MEQKMTAADKMMVEEAMDQDTLSSDLATSRTRIRDIRANMAASAVNLFAEVAKYAQNPAVDLTSFMRDCGIAEEDFQAFRKFSKLLDENKDTLVSGRLKFETIKALATSDSAAQLIALTRLNSGDDLSVRDVRAIKRDTRTTSFETKVFRESKREIKLRAEGIGRKLVDDIRAKALALHGAMVSHRDAWIRKQSKETLKLLETQQKQIQELAKDLHSDFKHVVGENVVHRRQWGHLAIDDVAKMHIGQVHYSLERMSRGDFQKGWFPQDVTEDYAWCSLDAIRYLAGVAPSAKNPTSVRFGDPAPLVAVSVHSGGGGHPLGLEAAGFRVGAIFDEDPNTLATLKHNRRDWTVRTLVEMATLNKLVFAPNERVRSIDLLTGAIQNTAWSANGKGSRKASELEAIMSLVRTHKPKSVLFEINANYTTKAHTGDRTAFESKLMTCGYAVRTLTVSANHFGIPQERKRAVVIGVMNGEAELARIKLPMPVPRTVHDLLANCAFPDHSSLGPTRPSTNATDGEQSKYDAAVENWATAFGKSGKLAPDIATLRDIRKRGNFYKTKWDKSGFLNTLKTDGPRLGDKWTKLPLTIQSLQRLQGIPDDWTFVGSIDDQLNQIFDVSPPQTVRAIAHALAAVLSGRREANDASMPPLIVSGKHNSNARTRRIEHRISGFQPMKLNADLGDTDRAKAYRWYEYVEEQEQDWYNDRSGATPGFKFPDRVPRQPLARANGTR